MSTPGRQRAPNSDAHAIVVADGQALPRAVWFAALAVFALAWIVYGRALGHDFVDYDTAVYVTQNPAVLAGLTWRGASWACTSFDAANWHPVTWLTHMLDVELFGLAPAGHHAVNVLLHAANGVLLLVLLVRASGALWPSAFVAAVFAVHPLHVESVAWIVERKDVLSTFFGLATLIAWTRWTRRPGWARYCAALGLFALGLASKPMLVTLPCVMLLWDVWPLRRTQAGARRLFSEKVPFFVLAAGACVLTVLAQRAGGAMDSLAHVGLAERFGNALRSYGLYLAKCFWPAGLTCYYPHPRGGLELLEVVLGGAAVLGGTIAAVRCRTRAAYVFVGWFVFLGTLVPVLGLVQVGGQALADRYMYLPMIGLLVALAWSVDAWVVVRDDEVSGARARRSRAAWIVGTIVVGLLTLLGYRQVGFWRNSESLARHALDVTTGNSVAHNLLGFALFRAGEHEEGLEHLAEAVRIEPGDMDARDNLGLALMNVGRLPEAERELTVAVNTRPGHAKSHYHLGVLLAVTGRMGEALPHLEAAARIEPRKFEHLDALAAGYASSLRFPDAIEMATRALAMARAARDAEHVRDLEQRLGDYHAGRASNRPSVLKPKRGP